VVDREIQARRANDRIDKCALASGYGKQMREAYRHRVHPLRPELDTLSRREHKDHPGFVKMN
jgi:hypothetical protein